MYESTFLDQLEYILFFIFMILIMLYYIITLIINAIKQKRDKKIINFDEFDNIELMNNQHLNDKQNMEYESDVINHVYREAYHNSIQNSFDNKNLYSQSSSEVDINAFDRISAHLNAQKEVEKAREHLYNFKVIDSVEHEEEDIKEGVPINALKRSGYNFDVKLFKKWSRQIFGCIKIGTDEQLQVVKKFISEDLYNKLEYQRNQFAKDGLEFVTEDLLIEKCKFYDYSRSMSKEEIKILINATMKEYIIEKSTNQVLRGNNEKAYNKNIIMTFSKHNIEETEGLIHNCPNCGAEVSQTEFGKCRYCNTLIFPIRYNWTLTKFETI